MRPVRVLLTVLFVASLIAPVASAQAAQPVSKCSRECRATDEDVNGPTPKTGKDPVRVVLYPHFDGIQRAPLNTQVPPEGALDENRGSRLGPAVALPGDAVAFRGERLLWWSTPGFVSYLEDGRAQADHDEHGLADDVQIAGDKLVLYLYLSAHQAPGMNSYGSAPELGVMPAVAIHARVESGRHEFNSRSTLIAEGDTDTNGQGRVHILSLPNSNENVYEFRVELDVKNKVIPAVHDELSGGYIVSIVVYQLRTEDWSAEASQTDWRVRTGDRFLPRLIIPVEEPMRTTYAWMHTFNERLFLRWSLLADFGSYDIDPDSIRLDVAGPAGPVDPDIVVFRLLKLGFDHDAHFKPANQTWGLDYRKVPLPDGEYTATGRAHNLQHTYELAQTWTFTVRDGVPEVSGYSAAPKPGQPAPAEPPAAPKKNALPAFDALPALAAVSAALLLAAPRRRR